MIAPEKGLAPLRWDHAGTVSRCIPNRLKSTSIVLTYVRQVTVARADHKPLTPVALEMYWMFCDKLIGMYPEGDADAQKICNPSDFKRFCREYKERYIENHPARKEEMEAQALPL